MRYGVNPDNSPTIIWLVHIPCSNLGGFYDYPGRVVGRSSDSVVSIATIFVFIFNVILHHMRSPWSV